MHSHFSVDLSADLESIKRLQDDLILIGTYGQAREKWGRALYSLNVHSPPAIFSAKSMTNCVKLTGPGASASMPEASESEMDLPTEAKAATRSLAVMIPSLSWSMIPKASLNSWICFCEKRAKMLLPLRLAFLKVWRWPAWWIWWQIDCGIRSVGIKKRPDVIALRHQLQRARRKSEEEWRLTWIRIPWKAEKKTEEKYVSIYLIPPEHDPIGLSDSYWEKRPRPHWHWIFRNKGFANVFCGRCFVCKKWCHSKGLANCWHFSVCNLSSYHFDKFLRMGGERRQGVMRLGLTSNLKTEMLRRSSPFPRMEDEHTFLAKGQAIFGCRSLSEFQDLLHRMWSES